MGVKFFVRFASSLSEGAFWHCASTNYKPALKGEVDASVTSRRRGCIEVVLVYANPSVNPPYGVLPAPRKGEPFGIALPKSCPRVRGKWHEVPKGVRLRGGCECNEQTEGLRSNSQLFVCFNPSVNPPCGVLPAPQPGSLLDSLSQTYGLPAPSAREPFGIALPKSCPRVRGKWHEVPKGVRLRGGCKCNEQPEVLHRGCSCLRQPLSQLRCQLPVRGAFWVPSPRMHAPDIPQIIAYMLKLTSISCFSIVTPIYIDNLMIIGYLITIRRGLCMKEINSFG